MGQKLRMPQQAERFILPRCPGPAIGCPHVIGDGEAVHALVVGVGGGGPDHGRGGAAGELTEEVGVESVVDPAAGASGQGHHRSKVNVLIHAFFFRVAALAEKAIHQLFRNPGLNLVSHHSPGFRVRGNTCVNVLGAFLEILGPVCDQTQISQPLGEQRGQSVDFAESAIGHGEG